MPSDNTRRCVERDLALRLGGRWVGHPQKAELRLFQPDPGGRWQSADFVPDDHDPIGLTLEWARNFLMRPHSELGRPGAVCPYTAGSISRKLFWLAQHGAQTVDQGAAAAVVEAYRSWFLELGSPTGDNSKFKTILILYPFISESAAPTVIDQVQARLKNEFVAEGLMIGQFHPHCPEPGLHNDAFRPLRTPVPLLAIRHMVETDLPFLRNNPSWLKQWSIRFEREGVSGCPHALVAS